MTMKNNEIHKGFTKEGLREFFATQMQIFFEMESQNVKKIFNHADFDDTFEWAIRDAEGQIKWLQQYILIMRSRQAVLLLINNEGWKEHDVSDDTYNDTAYRLHKCFIGTDDEYEDLLHKIYPQDKQDK